MQRHSRSFFFNIIVSTLKLSPPPFFNPLASPIIFKNTIFFNIFFIGRHTRSPPCYERVLFSRGHLTLSRGFPAFAETPVLSLVFQHYFTKLSPPFFNPLASPIIFTIFFNIFIDTLALPPCYERVLFSRGHLTLSRSFPAFAETFSLVFFLTLLSQPLSPPFFNPLASPIIFKTPFFSTFLLARHTLSPLLRACSFLARPFPLSRSFSAFAETTVLSLVFKHYFTKLSRTFTAAVFQLPFLKHHFFQHFYWQIYTHFTLSLMLSSCYELLLVPLDSFLLTRSLLVPTRSS